MTRTILTNATVCTLEGSDYGLIREGAVVIDDDTIVWVGPVAELPLSFAKLPQHDLAGRLMTPALIDCHTHLIFAGNRADEFEQRLQGVSYESIARAGGGILATVRATRAASESALCAGALPRVDALIADGVATIEVKSGYGLEPETELRMLRAARRLAALRAVRIRTSYLGAHTCPPEFAGDKDAYIDEICIPTLELAQAEGLVDAVDGFCEDMAFDTAQIGRVFEAAQALGVPVKLHAEQLSHSGGTALAVRYAALSADHLEYASSEDARRMAAAGTVAVLLPGAFYSLRETQLPPIDSFRSEGVAMALSTDCNPGSSPLGSLLLAMNMACTLFRLTPEEALRGVTTHAARALGLTDCGRIAVGLRADLAVWNAEHPAELAWHIGFSTLHERIFGGVLCAP